MPAGHLIALALPQINGDHHLMPIACLVLAPFGILQFLCGVTIIWCVPRFRFDALLRFKYNGNLKKCQQIEAF